MPGTCCIAGWAEYSTPEDCEVWNCPAGIGYALATEYGCPGMWLTPWLTLEGACPIVAVGAAAVLY